MSLAKLPLPIKKLLRAREDRDYLALRAGDRRSREGKQSNVGANIPDYICRLDEFLRHAKKDRICTVQVRTIIFKARLGRDKQPTSPELRRESSPQHHASTKPFYYLPQHL